MKKTITVEGSLAEALRGYQQANQRISAAMDIDDYEGAAALIDKRNEWACKVATCLEARTGLLGSAHRRAA